MQDHPRVRSGPQMIRVRPCQNQRARYCFVIHVHLLPVRQVRAGEHSDLAGNWRACQAACRLDRSQKSARAREYRGIRNTTIFLAERACAFSGGEIETVYLRWPFERIAEAEDGQPFVAR